MACYLTVLQRRLTFQIGRLRRFELYGAHRAHPSEEPRRQPPSVLVFHMADVDSCDATYVTAFLIVALSLTKSNVKGCTNFPRAIGVVQGEYVDINVIPF